MWRGAAPRLGEEGPLFQAQTAACVENPIVRVVLECLGGLVFVLNEDRRILAANAPTLEALERDPAQCLGLRPGDALGCIHAREGMEGCGSGLGCRACGVLKAVTLAMERQEPTEGECLLAFRRQERWGSREYQVRATPIQAEGHPMVILVLQDISDQKRREVLEATFLHDLANTLQGLQGWVERFAMEPKDPRAVADHLSSLSEQLSGTVQQQRLLLQAEEGQLALDFQPVPPATLLAKLDEQVLLHPAARDRRLRIQALPASEGLVWTDPRLLLRILLNMAINALEATPKGSEARVSFQRLDGQPEFRVWNPGAIPFEIGLRIFQRSFSTKAARGRGLGTYVMKVFGENHLGGEVGFSSSEAEGTCFYIRLPRGPSL